MNRSFFYIFLTIFFIFLGCGESETESKIKNINSLKNISSYKWELLGNKNLFFGHQSVGNNIIDGLNTIVTTNEDISITILETDSFNSDSQGIFAHYKVGNNSDPQSKIDSFLDVLKSNSDKNVDIAFLKLCFVDIKADTDVSELFSYYQSKISEIRSRVPDLTIVHFTVPITKLRVTWKTKLKEAFGKKNIWEYDHIKNKHVYNDMITNTYSGIDPIFDIASIESTYPDGSRNSFTREGKVYYSLIPEYTHDGAHLNDLGKSIVAEKLLLFLINL